MTLVLFIVDILFVCSFLLSAYCLGNIVHGKKRFAQESISILNLLLGFCFFSMLYLALGYFKVLYFSVLVVAYFVVLIFSILETVRFFIINRYLRLNFRKLRSVLSFVLLLMTLFVLFNNVFLRFLLPVDGYDALAYHIYQPFYYASFSHSFNPNILIPNSGLPLGYTSIVGWVTLFQNFHGASVLSFSFFCIMLFYQYWILRKASLFLRVMAVFVLFIVVIISGPTVTTNPSSDLYLAMFFLVVFNNLVSGHISHSMGKKLAFLIGYMPFIKATALFAVIPLLLAIVYKFRHRFSSDNYARQITSFIALGLIPFLSWSILNYVYIKNPFYPLFKDWFNSPGTGPEVLSLESDVRRSFNQVKRSFNDFSFMLSPQLFQVVTISIILFLSILSLFRLQSKILFTGSLIAAEIALVLYSGPVYRYSLFILVALLSLLFVMISESELDERSLFSFKQIPFLLVSCFFMASQHSTGISYPEIDLSSIESKYKKVSTTEEDFEKVVFFLKSNYKIPINTRIGIMGEDRALLFHPYETFVIPFDRRNPFADPKIQGIGQVKSKFQKMRIDILIVTSRWGLPNNVNLTIMEEFDLNNKDLIIFSEENWKIYDLTNS
jgi:hypothetical protein